MNLNYVRSTWARGVALAALLSFVFVTACDNNDDPKPPVVIEFADEVKVISEAAGPQAVSLSLEKSAFKNGTITITASPANASDWADFPTEIEIAEGNTVVQFMVTPVNNALLDEVRTITFTIAEPSKGFKLGAQTTLEVNITDDESPAQANFNVNSSDVTENAAEGTDVVINISAPAPGSGNLTVSLESGNAIYGTHYTTVPAATANAITIPVTAGQTTVSFEVVPVDNGDVNPARLVDFAITASSTEAITVGTILTTHAFTINDDEQPSTITFANASSSVSEAASEGQVVNLTLDPQTIGTGSVTISIASDDATYGTHFTTDPAATAGSLTVPVGSDVTSVSFKVIPVNDTEETANRIINFTTSASTGIVTLSASNNSHQVTITEDDIPTSIADVRALYTGTDVVITDDIFIQGVITSANTNLTSRNAVIQDATAGIVLRFNANNTLVRGDEVKVNLKNATITKFNGLLQIGGNLPNANAVKVADGTLPDYQVITIAQLNTGNYESELVKIENVGFFDANTVNTLRFNGGSGAGNNKFGDANGNTSILRVESYAPFQGDAIPLGLGNLQGIGAVFNTDWQIIPMANTDIFSSVESAIVTTGSSSLDFGDVANGATADLIYTVSGTSLVGDVVITAPNYYTVSTDNATFGASATIPAATANAGPVTVYVRFAPAAGVDQAITGTIVHKSLSASVKQVNVTGNETGNGGSTLLFNEQFDYGTAGNLTAVSGSNWVAHSGAGSTPVQYVSSSLSIAGYPENNIGGSSTFTGGAGTREDINRTFTAQNSGTIYMSALVNFSSAGTQDYFIHFMTAGGAGGGSFFGRLHVKDEAGVLKFGIQKTSGTGSAINYAAGSYVYGTTYILVMKHDFSTNMTSLFVLNSVTPTEPTADATEGGSSTNPSQLAAIGIRQGGSSYAGTIDGIRVALNWNDLFN